MRAQAKPQEIQAAIMRSDYMLHQTESIKQVEFNTISVSFAGLSARVSRMHSYISQIADLDLTLPAANDSDLQVAEAMYLTWKEYGRSEAVVCFLVQENEKNKFDQLHLQYLLQTKHGVESVRQTLDDMEAATVSEDSNRLFVNKKEVAVVYFRAGYGPGDYPSEKQWEIRKKIETSYAVKIPNVAWQLSGAKVRKEHILFCCGRLKRGFDCP